MRFQERHPIGAGLLALSLAAVLWLPCLHLLFQERLDAFYVPDGMAPHARALAQRHTTLWEDPASRAVEIRKMRTSNAEWDFMGRTFLVLAYANMGLRKPDAQTRYLALMDTLIEETLRLERAHGLFYFLMPYAREGTFVARPARSLFQDGEIALMLAARRLVEERTDYRPLLTARVDAMLHSMRQSPVLSGESYPDECWTFCNTVALAALRMADALDGTSHDAFLKQWVETARRRLTDPGTGLLISSYRIDGSPLDGPEGSSLWMAAHCLQLVDAAYAQDQYARARRALGRRVLGFGYAREWPTSWRGPADIDSGPVVPVLEISAGSSGLALLGAGAFGDRAYLTALLTSLNYGGFPVRRGDTLRYAAGNQVGDAVLLYAMVQGPLWRAVRQRSDGKKATLDATARAERPADTDSGKRSVTP